MGTQLDTTSTSMRGVIDYTLITTQTPLFARSRRRPHASNACLTVYGPKATFRSEGKLFVEEGHAIGRLDAAMALGSTLAPEHARAMMRSFTNLVVGRACSEFLELCERRLDTSAEDFQAPIVQPQGDIP